MEGGAVLHDRCVCVYAFSVFVVRKWISGGGGVGWGVPGMGRFGVVVGVGVLHLVGLTFIYYSKMHGHSNIKFKILVNIEV